MMKIIDAHLHFCPQEPGFTQLAGAAGHENSAKHLQQIYQQLGIVCGVVMGNKTVNPQDHDYPSFMRYCIGIDSFYLEDNQISDSIEQIEQNLKKPQCVGIKLYPGYSPMYVSDPVYDPVYELARAYKKPIAIHTGETSTQTAYLKYSHPMSLDEVAVRYPDIQFIMCHYGNPWLMDAAAVVSKNSNVAADISGLLEGHVDLDQLFKNKSGYLEALQTWMGYLHEYDDILFGTDWPLVNLEEYIEFVKRLIPENTMKRYSLKMLTEFISWGWNERSLKMPKLSDLPNIGKKVEEQLIQVGIDTPEKLIRAGSEEAWMKIYEIDDSACIHRLYGLEAAIQGVPKKMLSDDKKQELKAFYQEAKGIEK